MSEREDVELAGLAAEALRRDDALPEGERRRTANLALLEALVATLRPGPAKVRLRSDGERDSDGDVDETAQATRRSSKPSGWTGR